MFDRPARVYEVSLSAVRQYNEEGSLLVYEVSVIFRRTPRPSRSQDYSLVLDWTQPLFKRIAQKKWQSFWLPTPPPLLQTVASRSCPLGEGMGREGVRGVHEGIFARCTWPSGFTRVHIMRKTRQQEFALTDQVLIPPLITGPYCRWQFPWETTLSSYSSSSSFSFKTATLQHWQRRPGPSLNQPLGVFFFSRRNRRNEADIKANCSGRRIRHKVRESSASVRALSSLGQRSPNLNSTLDEALSPLRATNLPPPSDALFSTAQTTVG